MSEEKHEKSPEEYESMRKTVMQKKSIESITDEDLPYFVAYMNQYKLDLLDKEDYLGAKDAAAILDACKAENGARQKKTQDAGQAQKETNSIEKKKKEIDEKIEKFDQETATKQAVIQTNQNKEMEEFEKKWREEMPDKYRRVSKQLVELRETAKTLAMAGHYDEAAARKTEADQLEVEEHKEAQNQLRHDYRIAKSKLLNKQQGELKKFNESRLEKRDLFVADIRALEENEKNREFVLKSKPFSNKRSALRDSQNESHQAVLSRSLPRKNRQIKENKLPPLKPPNDKDSGTNPSSESPKQQKTSHSPAKAEAEKPKGNTSLKPSAAIKDKLDGEEKAPEAQ